MQFSIPDVLSIGLGGGSIVRAQGDRDVQIGPDSVGYAVATEVEAPWRAAVHGCDGI